MIRTLRLLNAAVVLGCLGLSAVSCLGVEEARDSSQINKISDLAKEVNLAAEEGFRPVIAICELSPKTGEVVRVNGVEQSLEAFLDSLRLLRGEKAKEVWVVCGIVSRDGKSDMALAKEIGKVLDGKRVMNHSVLHVESKI